MTVRCILAAVLSLCWGAVTLAADHVACTVQAGQAQQLLLIQGATDAYEFKQWDAPSGFRFSAQWLIPSSKLKTYVYFHGSKNRHALVHAAEKILTPSDCNAQPAVNYVYSERMEYELRYQCRRVCDAPPVPETRGAP